ncbi:hypothetical protein C8R44DRAFT_973953 [Mycena epipterygia]|nr:hypothetical protein C8R44DRAFT_973953 [Mycena epipterygia]
MPGALVLPIKSPRSIEFVCTLSAKNVFAVLLTFVHRATRPARVRANESRTGLPGSHVPRVLPTAANPPPAYSQYHQPFAPELAPQPQYPPQYAHHHQQQGHHQHARNHHFARPQHQYLQGSSSSSQTASQAHPPVISSSDIRGAQGVPLHICVASATGRAGVKCLNTAPRNGAVESRRTHRQIPYATLNVTVANAPRATGDWGQGDGKAWLMDGGERGGEDRADGESECKFGSRDLRTVHALVPAGMYYATSGPRHSVDSAWSIVSMLRLHREGARTGFDNKTAQRRRAMFWEVYSLDTYHAIRKQKRIHLQLPHKHKPDG